MDLRLPLLADINLHLGVAEEAIHEGDYLLARSQMEKAEESFAELAEGERDEALFIALLGPLEERAAAIREDLRLSRRPGWGSEKTHSSATAR